MNARMVRVRELAGWGFDAFEYRPSVFDCPKVSGATQRIGQRQWLQQSEILLAQETAALQDALLAQASRADLIAEMLGLEWSLGVVDLHGLIAFQRRLFFNPEVSRLPAPAAGDWPALTALSFGPAKSVECELAHDATAHTIVLRSTNPNLHFRTSHDAAAPLSIHAGSPFFEVACFRGRWFLRDGHHRAYTLLHAGIVAIPAVIVQARTMEELGATQPWFYPEDVLFSEAPPLVADFLEDDLVLEYDRPAMVKTMRIAFEETLAPAPPTGDQL
jgi:hypothetical protein